MWKPLLLAALVGVGAGSAEAADRCGPRNAVLELMAKSYGERPIAVGLNRNGHLLEVLAQEDGRTWTVIATTPRGVTCVLDMGEGWHVRQAQTADTGA